MFPKFLKRFKLKAKGKATGDDQKKASEDQKKEALRVVDIEYSERYKKEHPIDPREKVIRESGGQDITAI